MEEENNVNVEKKFSAVSVVSFVLSLVGILVAGLPCGIAATITGIIGLTTFKPEKQKGKWMAITGLVIGVLEILIMGLYVFVIASAL